jgi:hypothetical protein
MKGNKIFIALCIFSFLEGCTQIFDRKSQNQQILGDIKFSVRKVESNNNSDHDHVLNYIFRIADMKNRPNLLQRATLDKNDFTTKLQYLNFGIAQDFQLVSAYDTLQALDCHYADNFNLAPYFDFSLTFKKKNILNEKWTLIYQDNIFHNGKIKMACE